MIRKRIERARRKEKLRQKKKYIQREKELNEEKLRTEKELEKTKNDKLQAEMRHKDKELVNSTFHIIQKNKFLNSVKAEILKVQKEVKDDMLKHEFSKIIKKIDKDINNEKHWEVFDRYFDEVHQDFLNRLKEKHTDLTPKELRMCAYLRMNISTKEIAPLMNISVRGVEISRYRLRKKLNLDRDTNLTEYILSI